MIERESIANELINPQRYINTSKGVFDLKLKAFEVYESNKFYFNYKLEVSDDEALFIETKKHFMHLFNNCEDTFQAFLYFFVRGFSPYSGISHLLVFVSVGGERKTYFLNFIRRCFDVLCVTFDSLNLNTTNTGYVDTKIGSFAHTKVLIVNEQERKVSAKFMKSLTGKDLISSRPLFANEFFASTFNGVCIASANYLLVFEMTGIAVKRRVRYFIVEQKYLILF
ncbi:hypothetical protein CDIK_0939 [Cucumispora dikerogammari]|nr:hypothetical protein CDIK_0939 [Cucumispora dikerogammari]